MIYRIHPFIRLPGGIVAAAALALVVLVGGGCSTYQTRSTVIKQAFEDSNYDNALASIDEIDQDSSELLYLYEKGLVLHYQNQWEASNKLFQRAELLLEELYTKSVSRELAALAISDNITKFRGDSFEAIIINYYKILNYLYLGDLDGALVECRRVNIKLQMLIDAGETHFVDDPFVQYLTGMVYAAGGETNDAEVSFRAALSAYQDLGPELGLMEPPLLQCDVTEAGRLLGDFESDTNPGSAACPEPAPTGCGTLNLFLESGFVAHKIEKKVVLPIFTNDKTDDIDEFAAVLAARDGEVYTTGEVKVDYFLKIAVPALLPTPVPWDHAVVRPKPVGERPDTVEIHPSTAMIVENFDMYSMTGFEAKYGRILFRTVVRGLTKYAAKKGADKQDKALGWAVNWLGAATETADTRCWSTLPQKILMTRLVLPEGEYNLYVDLHDETGRKIDTLLIPGVRIDAGRSLFLNHRFF
jgi:tetratricopeptide (TPR) repeat protein